MVAVVAKQDRLQEECNSGAARLEDFAPSPPVEMDSNIGRIQHLEALVAELRRERDDLRSKRSRVEASREVGPDRSDVVPEALEELPRWITSTSARMAIAAGRETLRWLPSCQRSRKQEGRRWRVQRGDADNNRRSSLRSDQAVEIQVAKSQGDEAPNPGPQSTRLVNEDEPILPGRFSPRRHGDSAESVLIPGSPLDGFESVAPERSRRRGGLPNGPSEAVHPIQVASACRNQCRGGQPVIDKASEATGTSGFPIRSDDESRHLLSARRTPVTQPASVGPIWADFPMTDVSEREEAHRRPTRRVVLLPQPTGTSRSIQDQSHSGCEHEVGEGRGAVQMTRQSDRRVATGFRRKWHCGGTAGNSCQSTFNTCRSQSGRG